MIKLDDYVKRVIEKLNYKIVPNSKYIYEVVDKDNTHVDYLFSFVTSRKVIPGGVIHFKDKDRENWETKNLRQFQTEKTYKKWSTRNEEAIRKAVSTKSKLGKPLPRLGNARKKFNTKKRRKK